MSKGCQPHRFFDATGAPVARKPDRIRAGASAVIFNQRGEVLLERRADNGFWGLPGGGVDIGESVEQAIIREVLEETGLRVTVKRLIGIYSGPRSHSIMTYPNGDIVQSVTVTFECQRRSGEIRISNESTDIRYFPVNGLPENTLLSVQLRIRDAVANRPEPFIR